MTDGPAPGTSLEPEDPPPVAADPAAPVAAAPAAESAVEPEPEGAVEVAGQKMVPLSALLAERGEKKTLKERAQRADQLEQWVSQARPYVEFMQANPGLLQERAAPQPAAPAAAQEDAEAVEVAKMFDFYTPEGKPDTARGRAHLNLVDNRAMKIAQAAVGPIQQQSAQQRSVANFNNALQLTDREGRKPNAEQTQALRAIWNQMPVEHTADPRTAGVLAATALGLDLMFGRKHVAPAPGPPLVTEPSGGGSPNRPTLTALDRTIAANRGMSETKFAELQTGFRSGRSNVLEE